MRSPQAPIALCAALATALLALLATPLAARGLTAEDLTRLRRVEEAEISPDGRRVAYVLRVPRDPYAEGDGPAWTELHVARGPGEVRRYVGGEVRVSGIAWTRDGGAIAFRAKHEGDEHESVWMIPVDGGEARRIAGYGTEIERFALSPDGKTIAFVAREEKSELEKAREERGFDAEVVEEGLRQRRVWLATLGPDDAAGPDDVTALPVEGSVYGLRFSPDGKRLAIALAPTPLVDDRYMRTRLRVVDLEGHVLARIDNPGKLGEFAWSPDGARLALLSAADLNDPGASRLMVVPAGGGTPVDLLPDLLADVEQLAWRDATTLAYVVDRGTESAYAEIGIDGESRTTRLDFGGPIWTSLSLSADGARAAFVAETPRHPGEVYVYDGAAAGGSARRWTDSNPWLADVELAPQETVRWVARDGLEIEGVLIRPLAEKPGARHPLIQVVHGGPESHFSDGWNTSYSRPGQVAAARGYAVLHANYRGSTGRGVRFAKASQADYAGDPTGKEGGEFLDLVDGIEHLVATGLVDRDRVGITGGSYGGFASAWGATALTEHYAASVMLAGISDQISKFGTTDIPNEMYLVHARRWPWNHWDWFRERSPIYYAERARTPILILHGERDTRVHPGQAMELFRYLKTLGNVPVRLVLYPDEKHGNRKAAARYDYSLRLLRWMDHYLRGPGGDPPPYELPLDEERLGLEGRD